MELQSSIQTIMKEHEALLSAGTHDRIMHRVRVTMPLQTWGLRAYVALTSSFAAYSLWNTLTTMAEQQAFEFIQVAIDGLALDISVWPYFSSVMFDFIPGGWSIAFVANGLLLLFGIFAFRRWTRTSDFYTF